MANTTTVCNSFKQELLQAVHKFETSGNSGDTFKCALFTSTAALSASTTAYSSTNEITGTGYTAGGVTLTCATPAVNSGVASADFDDAVWNNGGSGATFSGVRYALIYNSSKSNKAVAVCDFGVDKSVSAGTFTVTMPESGTGVVRVA